jgi:hypothetical protein
VRCIDDGERYGCVMQEQTSIDCGDDAYCVPPTETFTNPSCGYCDVFLGATLATIGEPCLEDSQCGGASGSCHRTNALCVTPSGLTVECAYDPHPFAENTPPECGGSKCYQTCPFGSETITAVVNPDCLSLVGGLEDPPYQYCPVECEAFPDPPNVGDTCEDDTDCDGGTSCKTDCDLSSPFLSAFCFETPTCQY